VLRINQLDIAFGDKVLLEKGELSLDKPELVILAGKNGAGKSTLLKMLCGLQPIAKGELYLNGDKILAGIQAFELKDIISFMPSTPPQQCFLTVEELVNTSHIKGNSIFGKQGIDTIKYLRKVGMESFTNQVFNSLSDGEKQKVMIARALAQETPILLLDEPLAFLDYPSKIELLELLKEVCKKEQKLIIFSSHDLELSMQQVDAMILMKNKDLTILNSKMLNETNPATLFQ